MAHKNPSDRAHVWEQGPKEPAAAAEPSTYRHELPRHVHKAGGESKIVSTPDECDAALKSGWKLLPPKAAEPKADDPKADEPPAA